MRWLFSSLLVAALSLFAASPALAKRDGIGAQGCVGCHRGGQETKPTLDAGGGSVALGAAVTITLSIPTTNGPSAGMYLYHNGKGTLSLIDGEGTKMAGGGIVHTTPKRSSGGPTTFRVRWTAPATPGGVTFEAWVLSGNGDGGSGGDGDGHAFLALAYGCDGNNYYNDGDNDGYGSMAFPAIRDCAKPAFFTDNNTDCNDYNEKIHPGAQELCNMKDDNCNGMVDENLKIEPYYEDKDGDGVGAGTNSIMTCGIGKGYGAGNNDCNDSNAEIYPGAPELCNFRDDNCNGVVDEGARTYCGTGWCRRAAEGCGQSVVCTVGKPRAEQCNAFDDDCDGVIDNGSNLCTGGKVCKEGYCLAANEQPPVTNHPPEDSGIVTSPNPNPNPSINPDPDEPGGCAVSGGQRPLTVAAIGLGLALTAAGLLVRRRRRR